MPSQKNTKPQAFGAWVIQARKARKLSRQQVSQRCNGQICQQYVHFIEIGRATNIGSDKLSALAQGLGLPVEVLQAVQNRGLPASVPVIGRVAAGPGVPSDDEEFVESLTHDIPAGLFAVEVMGDSMAPKIAHGDLAIARPWQDKQPLIPGQVYLIREGRKTTCKYLLPLSDSTEQWVLRAEQPHLFPEAPLDLSRHKILGQVIEVRKTGSLGCPVL